MAHHHPVLSEEVIAYLKCQSGKNYIDCTLGGGGHAALVLEKTSPGGRLLGIDWDGGALRIARDRLTEFTGRVIFVRDNFSNLITIVRERGFGPVDGILLDLGVSSFQLEDSRRGFSFRVKGPLDMRMDPSGRETASNLVNRLPAKELEVLLRDYGEERWARRISQSVEKHRQRDPILTTAALTDIIHSAIPASFHSGRIDPATKTFMALRIAVNKELDNLKAVLSAAISVLRKGGRICVISFHSLEDRIVKDHFRTAAKGCTCPPHFPQCVCHGAKTLRTVTSKPLSPSQREIGENPRARSAKLRVAERI
jgi:16S rRNA (cytosine1402-N4)-methyltransferase